MAIFKLFILSNLIIVAAIFVVTIFFCARAFKWVFLKEIFTLNISARVFMLSVLNLVAGLGVY